MGEDKGLTYLQQLAKQNIASVDASARQILDEVIAGEYSIALQIFNHHTVIGAAQGAPSDWIRMEPAMVVLNIMSLTAHAPHPNAGKLLFDYLESEVGQKLFRAADYLPADPAVPPRDASLTPESGHFRARAFSPEALDADMPHWSEVYHRRFQRAAARRPSLRVDMSGPGERPLEGDLFRSRTPACGQLPTGALCHPNGAPTPGAFQRSIADQSDGRFDRDQRKSRYLQPLCRLSGGQGRRSDRNVCSPSFCGRLRSCGRRPAVSTF